MITKRLALSVVSIVILTSIVVYSADAAGIPKKAISTVSRFIESDLPTTTLFTDVQNTITSIQQFTTTSAVFENPAKTFGTTLAGGAVTANRTLNLPVITGTDTVATLGLAQTFTGAQTINSLILGGDVNVGSNSLTTSGHKSTLPSNTGTLLQANGSGSSLTGIVTSATGTANNVTVSASTGAVTWNLGSNVVTTGGSTQIVTKNMTFSNTAKINGLTNSVVSKTGAYSITTTDDTVLANANGGAFTLTLPSPSSNTGKIYTIKKIDTTNNKVTISGSIDGISSSVGISTPYRSIQFQSDGSVWRTIGGNNTVPYAYMYNNTASGTLLATAAASTQYKIAYNTDVIKSGITHVASSSTTPGNGADITVLESGIYRVVESVQVVDANTAANVVITMKVNGVDIPNGVCRQNLAADGNGFIVPINCDGIMQLEAGDTITVWYMFSSTSVDLETITPTNSPYIPLADLQIFKIGG